MSSIETELDRSINTLYDHMITNIDETNPVFRYKNWLLVNDSDFRGMRISYSYKFKLKFFCVVDNMNDAEMDTRLFETEYEVDKDDPDSLRNQHKKMCKDIFKLCKVEFYDKVSNKIFLSKEDMDKSIKENMLRAQSIIAGNVEECCVCMELCGTQLKCCNGWLCYKCYNKTHKRGECSDCGGCDCKVFICPLCRTQQ